MSDKMEQQSRVDKSGSIFSGVKEKKKGNL